MSEIDPLLLMIIGIVVSVVGIGLLWGHPLKWKVSGTVFAITGVIINVINVIMQVNILQ